MPPRTLPPATWAMVFLALAVWGLPLAATANDAIALKLGSHAEDYDAWAIVRMLPEGDRTLTPAQAIAEVANFSRPNTPRANLGVRKDAVWFALEVALTAGATRDWILSIDYPALDRLEVAVANRGEIQSTTELGRDIAHPYPTRSHLVPLHLQPGERYVLLMRVATSSSMIVPIRLMTPRRLAEREARIQLIQGMAAGIGLCLFFYALAHGISLRDSSFFHYALAVGCMSLFFFTFEGLSAQHVWASNVWLTRNAAPFLVLPALAGGLLFLERALKVGEIHPWFGRAMALFAAIATVVAALFVIGVIDYRQAQLAATTLGPTPILLGLPAAWLRARAGNRIAIYILVGWGLYAIGIFNMAALLRGMIPFNGWTQYAFQVGCLAEMVIWVLVLGVRAAEIRQRAETAEKEHRNLHRLAHTDPLTGLLNRRGLHARLEEEIPAATTERLAAIYLVDLDGFKAVNDQLGHEGGDELLRGVGRRLCATMRTGDVIGRLGGDEFVVLIRDVPREEDARRIGNKILKVLTEPFRVGSTLQTLGATIGYAIAPTDGRDPDTLLRSADQAMYAGKQAGKNCVERSTASPVPSTPKTSPDSTC